MAEIIQVNGQPVIDYMARDYESLLGAMRDAARIKLPEWTDVANEADFGNVMLQLFAHMGDIVSYYQDRVANESFLTTATTRRSVIEHLRLIGYTLGTAAPATASLEVSVPAAVTGSVTVSAGDAFATKSQRNKSSVRFEYTSDTPLVIDFGSIKADQATGRRVFKGLSIQEGRSIRSEIVGVSDGTADQRFVLAHAPLILRPLGTTSQAPNKDIAVLTRLGTTVEPWTLQETLAFSHAGQKDFTIEIDDADQATLVFGDGGFGLIPPKGAQIEASYRVGGGAAGNTAPRTIEVIADAPQLALLGARVSNPLPATEGADREGIDRAKRHAPAVFRSMKRAVTAADYEALALSFKGVGKVRARPGGWNTVTLFVAPEGGWSKVSDVLEADLKTFFEDKRMVSQIVQIDDVDYVPIYVTAEVGVTSYYTASDVLAGVQQAMASLLAFDNVDFGQTLYLSKFYEVGEAVPGVLFINITEFRRGDAMAPPVAASGKIALGPDQIPKPPDDATYAGGVQVVLPAKA